MRLLGETVAQLRAANRWSLQDLAARVRQQGARSVKYQHIQNLENKPDLSPRYLPELAAAFGKTVEELRTWEDGDPALGHHPGPGAGNAVGRLLDRAYRIADEPYVSPEYSDDEKSLIADFRACPAEAQQAIRTLLQTLSR